MCLSRSWTSGRGGRLQSMKKESPAFAGLMVACLLVLWRSVSALLVLISFGLGRAACLEKEQALCQTNPTSRSRANRPGGAPADAKFHFGQYVTSAGLPLLSKSSTQNRVRAAT